MLIKKLDLFAEQITFESNDSKKISSWTGVVLILFSGIVTLIATIFFSLNVINKKEHILNINTN